MKQITIIIISIILAIVMIACTACTPGYTSSYKAKIMTENKTLTSYSASFESLSGRIVIKAKRHSAGEGDIQYAYELSSGAVGISYSYDKKSANTLVAQEDNILSDSSSFGYLEKGQVVYIILDFAENSKGSIIINWN